MARAWSFLVFLSVAQIAVSVRVDDDAVEGDPPPAPMSIVVTQKPTAPPTPVPTLEPTPVPTPMPTAVPTPAPTAPPSPSKEALDAQVEQKVADAKIQEVNKQVDALKHKEEVDKAEAAHFMDDEKHKVEMQEAQTLAEEQAAERKIKETKKTAAGKLKHEKEMLEKAAADKVKVEATQTENKLKREELKAKEHQAKAEQEIEERERKIKEDQDEILNVASVTFMPEDEVAQHVRKVELEAVKAKELMQEALDKKGEKMELTKMKGAEAVEKATEEAGRKVAEEEKKAAERGSAATVASERKLNKIRESVSKIKEQNEEEKMKEEVEEAKGELERSKPTLEECQYEDAKAGKFRKKSDCQGLVQCFWHNVDGQEPAHCGIPPPTKADALAKVDALDALPAKQ